MKGTFVVRGSKLRTQSHFRYQLVVIRDGQARIWGRTDSLERARKRVAERTSWVGDRVNVILDSVTGQEV